MEECLSNKINSLEECKKYLSLAVAELIHSEEMYIDSLRNVVNGYMTEYFKEMPEVPLPNYLRNYDSELIFGNIAEIYEFHKLHFLEALKENYHSVCGLSNVFMQNEPKFQMYIKYIYNKPISEYLTKKHLNYFDTIKKKLHHKNSLEDLLIAPVQRIIGYKMLLKDILKYSKGKEGADVDSLNEAINMLTKVLNDINELPNLTYVKKIDILILKHGNILGCGSLMCTYEGKERNLFVLLFKRLIVFASEKREMSYKTCLKLPMNVLPLKELSDRKFALQRMDATNFSITCEAHTREHHTKWMQEIMQQINEFNSSDHKGGEVK